MHYFYFIFSATVFNNAKQHINVYGDDVEVDYRGYEVKDWERGGGVVINILISIEVI